MATTTPDRIQDYERTTTASPVEQHAAPTQDTAGRSGKATAGFIVGIVGILGAIIPIVGLILGVIATSLSAVARGEVKRTGASNRWMATSGLVLGIVAIALSLLIWAGNIALMAS
jgi:hypothetical protein